jgi:DNA-binding transcriptional LysR family regulator
MPREPDFRQLRYFIAVAEELHFTRAAARLGIAQPPLTQQIQKLESLLGCPLLTRGRTTTLTAAGAVLLDQARGLQTHLESVIETTRRAARGETGRLALGVPPSVMLSSLPSVIRRYRAAHPEVSFTLREMGTTAIERALVSEEIDLGFLREATPGPPLTARVLYKEPVVIVLPRSHRLARTRSLSLQDLRHEPFVLFPRRVGPVFHEHLISLCVAAGFTPNIVEEATQWQSVVSLVAAGVGVTIGPACIRKFRWPDVVFRPLPRAATTVLACWRDDLLAPAAAAFLKMAGSALAPSSRHQQHL